MITRARFRLLAAAVLLSASGCGDDCSLGSFDESFKWPISVKCPPPNEAALYMAGFGPGQSGISLVSVDGPGVHTKDGCTYPVTGEFCSGGHIN